MGRGAVRSLVPLLSTLVVALMTLGGATGRDPAWAAGSGGGRFSMAPTLYVDQANPTCTDRGSGTRTQPYCTIGAAAKAAQAGQTVQVATGTYPETVAPNRSGTSTAPIAFAAAPGATVVVTGGTAGSGFNLSSRNWITVTGFTISQCLKYGVSVSSSTGVTIAASTVQASGGDGIHVSNASALTVRGNTIAGAGGDGVYLSGASSSTVADNTVSGTGGDGIYASSSTSVTLSGNTVSGAGQPASGQTKRGIYLSATTGSLVVGNTSHNNTDAGIALYNGSTSDEVRDNVTYANARGYTRAAPGIDIRSAGDTVDGNVSYRNEDSGIQFYNGGGSSLVYNNVSYDNGDHGIDDLNSPNQVIVANTVFGNTTAGINLEGTAGTTASSGATVANNVSVDNGLQSFGTKGNIRVDANSTAGTSIDDDLVSLSASGFMFTWGNTMYTSLAALQAATGQETHGIQADPLFRDPAGGDFRLAQGSPAIDSADPNATGEPLTDADGNPRNGPPDRGAYEFQAPASGDAPPSAALTVDPSTGTTPLSVTADASGSTDTDATPIASYRFDFGDGTIVGPQAGPTATHTYACPASGTYTVTVMAIDTAGLDSTAAAQVTIPSGNLVCDPGFETGTSGWAPGGSAVTLSQVSGGHTGSYAALIANGGTTTVGSCTLNDSPNWVAAATASTYHVSLWVRADAGGATLTLNVREYALSGGTFLGSQKATVTLTTGWQQVALDYTPASPGASTLDVNAFTSNGPPGTCFYADDASITTGTVVPPDAPPSAALTVDPSMGSTPLSVTADASASTDTDATPIASYRFDFGDGTIVGPQAGPTATHTYACPASGTYTVTVTVADTAGLSSKATAQVTVAPGNLVCNPGFETGTSGWAPGGTGVTLSQVSGGRSGAFAALIANGGTSTASSCTLNDAPNWVAETTASTYHVSLWVRADTEGATLKLNVREYGAPGGAFLGAQMATVTLTTAWQQISVDYTPAAPGASTLDVNAYTSNAPPGTCFYADDASITTG